VFGSDLQDLSAQNLIDCSEGGQGCSGGNPHMAMVTAFSGVESESDYPYEGVKNKCRYDASKAAVHFTPLDVISVIDSPTVERGEFLLKRALVNSGPAAALIDASSASFKNYTSGVYFNPDCSRKFEDLHHAVLVVGYGTDPKEGDFWIVVSGGLSLWTRPVT